jgi:hypothetical protein
MVEYEPPQVGHEGFSMDPARIRYDLYRLLASIYASEHFPHDDIDVENPRILANLSGDFEGDEITHLLLAIAISVRTAIEAEPAADGVPQIRDLPCGELCDPAPLLSAAAPARRAHAEVASSSTGTVAPAVP